MHFFILGSLEVKSPEKRIQITAPKQRAVLAALLLGANNDVPIDQLIRYVWDGRPPATGPARSAAAPHRPVALPGQGGGGPHQDPARPPDGVGL